MSELLPAAQPACPYQKYSVCGQVQTPSSLPNRENFLRAFSPVGIQEPTASSSSSSDNSTIMTRKRRLIQQTEADLAIGIAPYWDDDVIPRERDQAFDGRAKQKDGHPRRSRRGQCRSGRSASKTVRLDAPQGPKMRPVAAGHTDLDSRLNRDLLLWRFRTLTTLCLCQELIKGWPRRESLGAVIYLLNRHSLACCAHVRYVFCVYVLQYLTFVAVTCAVDIAAVNESMDSSMPREVSAFTCRYKQCAAH